MKIERIPDDVLVLRQNIRSGTLPDEKKFNISIGGSNIIVELPEGMYEVSIESIVRDVIEFSYGNEAKP